ncbi:MAG: hypothetical protein JOZ02_16195 [Acidobacteria bacterium]|nr:hypothetical protein [Acidobacteriota bacterium]
MIASVILGAGFSYVAGLPLTKDLFETSILPSTKSDKAKRNHEEVMAAWKVWKKENPEGNAEQWLRLLYENRGFALLGTTWENALNFAMARLVKLPPGRNAAYYHGITTCIDNEVHKDFWEKIRGAFTLKYVVSMNYDILAEQGLKCQYSKERVAPICYYGGFQWQQVVKKMTDVTKHRYENVELGHEVALFKMHGSINWAFEPHGFKIHDDVRAAFRVDQKLGEVAIIPPLPEKDVPDWLINVWKQAEESLSHSQVWIICGYSLPDYDVALKNFFKRAADKTFGLRLYILDPFSSDLAGKWENIAPVGTVIKKLPGLPEGLENQYWL